MVSLPPGWMPYQVLQHPALWGWWAVRFPMGRVLLLLQPVLVSSCLPLAITYPTITLFPWAVWYEFNPQRLRGGLNLVSHRPCGLPYQRAIQGKATATSKCFNNSLIPLLVLPVPKMKCFAICFAWNYSTKLLPIYEWIWLPQNLIFS